MPADARAYLEECIIPLIAQRRPRVAAEMRVVIEGSYALGLADALADSGRPPHRVESLPSRLRNHFAPRPFPTWMTRASQAVASHRRLSMLVGV
jgi:hypothetical protein